jgi:hypothetical protein
MTRMRINSLLISLLIILIAGLGILKLYNPHKLNYFKLNESFYLNKLDYFSSYTISTFKSHDYQDDIEDVKGIAINEDNIVVCFMDKGAIQYASLNNDSVLYNQAIGSNLDFVKPWKIVEQVTLNSRYKLLNQILIISIIIIGFYLVMRVFNIKKLIKSP